MVSKLNRVNKYLDAGGIQGQDKIFPQPKTCPCCWLYPQNSLSMTQPFIPQNLVNFFVNALGSQKH
jgi:hypothetical protein